MICDLILNFLRMRLQSDTEVLPKFFFMLKNSVKFSTCLPQGLTLRFQARGPKRSFDKNKWSKTGFLVNFHTILGLQTEKSRGPQQNLGAYAPRPLGKSNPVPIIDILYLYLLTS